MKLESVSKGEWKLTRITTGMRDGGRMEAFSRALVNALRNLTHLFGKLEAPWMKGLCWVLANNIANMVGRDKIIKGLV